MSETKNLKLFKHDEPLETNENQFNIKKALHDNWDKLDEFGGIVNTKTVEIENKQKQHDTDISNIKQEQQDQNSKIENNTVENKDNTELLNQIMGLLPSTKGEGEHVTLQDTGETRFKKFEVQGNSKQETRSGKNKFDINLFTNNTLITDKDSDTGSFKLSNAWTSLVMNNTNVVKIFKANTKYKIIVDITLLSKPSNLSQTIYAGSLLALQKAGVPSISILGIDRAIKENWQVDEIKHIETIFTTPNDLSEFGLIGYCYYTDNNKAEGSFKFENVMLLEVTEQDETFEQYGASPSPEYPSKIRNVGDNMNWFNKDGNYVEGSAKFEKIETGIKVTVQSAGNYRYIWVDLGGKELLGKKLTMSSNIYANAQNDPKVIIYAGTKTSPSKSIIKGAELSKSIKAATFQMPDTFPEGTDSFRVYLYGNFMGTSQIGDYVEYRDFKIEEGTQATAYSSYNCGNAEITVGNKNLANTKIIKNTNIITVNEDGSLTLANNSNTAGYASTGKKLNEQQTIVFPFTEGQKLYKGDYLAENGIHHVRNQIVLDGTEGWQLGGSGNNLINQRFYLANNDIKPNGAILCNYFKEMYRGNIQITVEDIEACNISNGRYIQIKINKKIASTVDGFKNWIKQKKNEGNPITLECEVESEIIEPYTQEQQEAYNKLKKLYSYNEQTNIFSKDEISPVFNVEAIKNLNATFAQLSATMLERS